MVVLGERDSALRRLNHLEERIRGWMQREASRGEPTNGDLQLKHYTVQVVSIGILMNNRQPARAAELAKTAVVEFDSRRRAGLDVTSVPWRQLEMDLCHVHSVALALDGDLDGAVQAGERAVALASREDAVLDPGLDVISTYSNILLARDPDRSEQLLRQTRDRAALLPENGRTRINLCLNLSMCLIVLAHRDRSAAEETSEARLAEALALLKPLFTRTIELGRLSEAAAAALLTGLIHAMRHDGSDIGWFADAVNAAARAHQMETLWRAHLNLASSMHRDGHDRRKVGEHARAAYEILMDTLSPYSQPELSHRFSLVRVPLAHAVRFLLEAGDPAGERALFQMPALQECFADPNLSHRLHADRGGFTSHEWLRDGEYDYVIY